MRWTWQVAGGMGFALLLGSLAFTQEKTGKDRAAFFAERVAPILKSRCIECHRSDKARGSLDLSTRAALLEGGEHGPAIVPGDAKASLLLRMVQGAKPKMPRQRDPLSRQQVADVAAWIDDGAAWPQDLALAGAARAGHPDETWWSLRPLDRPAVPVVKDKAWGDNPIDAFVLAVLESKGMKPSKAADRRTYIRRVTYDLHGLPPTPKEIDDFVNDAAPDAVEKLVDRLLASPRFGERWGRHWLDIVHYADTHGYDKDKVRRWAWLFRDWVIRALNQDMPYRRFVRMQIAGDVLFPGDPDGIIATGFVVAGPWDFVGQVELREGTVDKEKTRLLDRDDMVANTMSTFCSLTVHCARCHDHKFDPIPQKDYYRLQAVFAGVERGDRPVPLKELSQRRQPLEAKRTALAAQRAAIVQAAERQAAPTLAKHDAELQALRQRLDALPRPAGTTPGLPSPSNGYHSLIAATPDGTKWVQIDLGRSVPLDAVRLVPARPTDFPDTPGFGFPVRFKVAISDDPRFTQAHDLADHTASDFANPGDMPLSLTAAGRKARYIRITASRLWKRTGDYVFALAEVQALAGGKNVAAGAAVTALDSIEAGRWARQHLVDGFDSRRRLPDPGDPSTAPRLAIESAIQDGTRRRIAALDSALSADGRRRLQALDASLGAVVKELAAVQDSARCYAVLPIKPRPIHLLARGDVERKGALVAPGALTLLPGLDAHFRDLKAHDEGARRAALAEWIVDDRNVLAWRSIANRVWHYHFGRGLVDTPNDFGKNGSQPTHPALLDWLACALRDNGGSLKKLHRRIVLSRAYSQASTFNAEYAKTDGDNRYLWRAPRQRLDAESMRDSVLAVSGKLDLKMYGPGFELFRFKDDHSPVYDHLDVSFANRPDSWRRTVYRFVVRSVPNPFLESLDCADPNINVPVRNTTLTAPQALALLNNPFMLKQAEYFAERVRTQSGSDVAGQVAAAYRFAFGRPPTRDESEAVTVYVRRHGLANACRLLFNANEFMFVD